MLGKLLGISPKKPALPKNQIEVICPVCGGVQREPRLVVTTMCRQCGEHLRIEKKKVIASSQINPVPSAIYPALSESQAASPAASAPPTAPPSTSQAPTSPPAASPSALLPSSAIDVPPSPGMGNILMGVNDAELEYSNASQPSYQDENPEASWPSQDTASELSSEIQPPPLESPVSDLASTSSSPPPAEETHVILPPRRARVPTPPLRPVKKRPEPVRPPEQSTFQKMREQGIRQQHFKEVECFDCHHKFKVGRSARNSQCPNCSSNICMEDIDINVTSTAPIRTRGDVYIRKMGNVSTSEIKCRDLHLQGIISANVECSGELIIRTAGTIVGEIHCIRLHVVKGSDIQLINTIYADEVEIYARLCGNIHCNGPVLIGAGGCVEGDVTARSVNIEPGGHLDGAMNILRPPNKKPKNSPPPDSNQPTLPL